MAVAETSYWFPRLWSAWKTSILALISIFAIVACVSLAQSTLHSTFGRGDEISYVGWTVFFMLVWGGLGIGGTYAYLRVASVDASFVVDRLNKETARILGGLIALITGVFSIGAVGIWTGIVSGRPFAFLVTAVGAVPGTTLESWPAFFSGILFMMVLLALFVGPAVAALTHGILQNTIRDVTTPCAGIGMATLLLAVLVAVRTSGEVSVGAFLVACMIGVATGSAYERTNNLLIPMVAYGVTAALSLAVMSLPMILDLYATFGATLP